MAREKLSLNKEWRFFRYEDTDEADGLIYDIRPDISEAGDYLVADAKRSYGNEVGEQYTGKEWAITVKAASPGLEECKLTLVSE